MGVNTTCKKLVKPSTPTPSHLRKFKQSSFDQLQPTFYVSLIFHYCATAGVESALGRVHRLEQSLSQMLTVFYHLAGRYGRDGNVIDCNDQGIEFVEAKVDYVLDQLLLDGGADQSEMLLALPVSSAIVAGSSLPLVAIQVNVFKCGGLVVSVQISHIIGDMHSMCTFLNAWATKCRQIAEEIECPDFNLASLFPPKEDLEKVFQSSFVSKDQVVSLGRKNLTLRKFVFKNECLSKLRAETATIIGSERKKLPSRVVLLTALLCRVLMSIDRAKSGRSRPMVVDHMLNLRGRTNLPVQEKAFGNFYVDVTTAPLVTDKDPSEKEPLHRLVDWVGNTLEDAVAEFGEAKDCEELARNAEARVKQVFEMLNEGEISVVTVSSWCRFPLHGVDYGWGRPSLASTVKSTLDKVIFLMDSESEDGIEAWLTLEEEDMANFEHDPDILTYMNRS